MIWIHHQPICANSSCIEQKTGVISPCVHVDDCVWSVDLVTGVTLDIVGQPVQSSTRGQQ